MINELIILMTQNFAKWCLKVLSLKKSKEKNSIGDIETFRHRESNNPQPPQSWV